MTKSISNISITDSHTLHVWYTVNTVYIAQRYPLISFIFVQGYPAHSFRMLQIIRRNLIKHSKPMNRRLYYYYV